jgi:hypothetical protein
MERVTCHERRCAMKTTEDLFAGDGWESLHDVVVELDCKSRTKEEIRAIFDKLPERVRRTAHLWGLSDTVFRDEVYEHLRRNPTCYQP